MIAILCASPKSAYFRLKGVQIFDRRRDARSFGGGMAIVAHPPCRAWSAHCGHQAKPEPGEKDLGLWCVEQVRRWGGVLEQPANSRLWAAAGLPVPGQPESVDSWSAEVWQAWWGYPMRKATWLYFSKIRECDVEFPFRLHPRGGDRRAEQVMSRHQRSATTPEFAEWLVGVAQKVRSCEFQERVS